MQNVILEYLFIKIYDKMQMQNAKESINVNIPYSI